jgi:hypothetical protein
VTTDRERRVAVSEALARCGRSTVSRSGVCWDFELANGAPLKLSAKLDDEWLTIRSAGHPLPPNATPWDLLHLNRTLGATSKLVSPRPTHDVDLRAEFAIGDHADVRPCLEKACTDLVAAHAALQGGEFLAAGTAHALDGGPARADADPANRDSLVDLEQCLRDAGRASKRSSDDSLVVRLETTEGFRQARVHAVGDGVRIVADLVVSRDLSKPSQDAMGVFLLSASAQLRLVRAAAERRAGQVAVVCEVALAACSGPEEVGRALEGLTVAWEEFGREAVALTHPSLARTYLTYTHTGG